MSFTEVYQRIKQRSEAFWATKELDPFAYGFQIQQGTKWKAGLNDEDIIDFEEALGFKFPVVYREYLKVMNGTDTDTINIYGSSGHAFTYNIGFYSYPDDLEAIKTKINWILDSFGITKADMIINHIPNIIPIVAHRFLVADHCDAHPILSMFGSDVILYDNSLPSFLENNLYGTKPILDDVKVPFWIEE